MKPFTRRRFAVLAAATGLAWLAAPALAASDVLRVGVSSTPQVESLQIAVKEAKAQGLNVELVEFSDWNTPNAALANGDIDVNYFQHIPFLENAKKQGGYDFVSVGTGTIMKIGLYSHKWKSFADIPVGGKVAIASDPVNGGRGLLLLERAGLIKLKPGLGYKATTLDIVANPKKLNIIALEASQLARAMWTWRRATRRSCAWRAKTRTTRCCSTAWRTRFLPCSGWCASRMRPTPRCSSSSVSTRTPSRYAPRWTKCSASCMRRPGCKEGA